MPQGMLAWGRQRKATEDWPRIEILGGAGGLGFRAYSP